MQDSQTRIDYWQDKTRENRGDVGQTAPEVGEVLPVSKIPLIIQDLCTHKLQGGVDYDNPWKTNGTIVGHLDPKIALIILNESRKSGWILQRIPCFSVDFMDNI